MSGRSWSTREELTHQLVALSRQGMSQRAIARTTGVSRNTVQVLLARHSEQRQTEHSALGKPSSRAPRATKLDGFDRQVATLLVKYPDITAQRVLETLRDEHGFDGGYTAVKRYLRRVRPKPKPAPSRVTPDHGPGGMAESDWSPYDIPLLSGAVLSVQAFGYALRHSTRKAYSLFQTSDLHALMDGHVLAFDRFKGCAKACMYDSQKPVVLRWEGHQPIFNPRFLAFAAHYEFRLEAVRGKPNAKPRVERNFWELERSFLNGRSFRDFDDLKAQLAHWLDHIVDQRRRHGRTSLDRFAEEHEHLLPLPRHPYDTARVAYRLCSVDGFIDWAGNRYAVPYDHVTDLLPVRITQHELFVYAANLQCVARHELAPRGQGHKLDPFGYHPRPRRDGPGDLDQLRSAFEHMGEGALDFIRLVASTPPRNWAHHARKILRLRERSTPRGNRVNRIPLATGVDLLIEPTRTVGPSWTDAFARIERFVSHQNVLFETEESMRAEGLVVASTAMRATVARVVAAAAAGARAVLLTGPSGSGKEGLARCFHRHTARSGAFVPRNCGMFTADLMRAELFGAERGAFTGCVQQIVGAVETANEGTLFLDEIGELSADVQPVLLRFLDHGEYERLGGSGRLKRSDVRIVAATNRDLRAAATNEDFRVDLWFRLSVHVIDVPALRERPEDILAYLQSYGRPDGRSLLEDLETDALARACRRSFRCIRTVPTRWIDAPRGTRGRWVSAAGRPRPPASMATPREAT